MRYFTINKIVNVIGAILFVIMGIFLILGFAFNLFIVDELQQASNFDNWKYFILLSGIVAIITAIIFGFGAWKVTMIITMTRTRMRTWTRTRTRTVTSTMTMTTMMAITMTVAMNDQNEQSR